MTVLTSRHRIPAKRKPRAADPAAPVTAASQSSRRRRLLLASTLLVLSIVITTVQVRASRWFATRYSPFSHVMTLRPQSQSTGVLTLSKPATWGTYTVDLVFPDSAGPRDYGLAWHEIRRNVHVTVQQKPHEEPLAACPAADSLNDVEDELDSRGGVELCDFHAESATDVTITCELSDGAPWPAEVQIGLSHSASEARLHNSRELTRAARPWSFTASALLACTSLLLCWRPGGA